MGTDESTFINIFATRSWAQLKLISAEYQNIRGRTLETAVRGEFSGWLQTTLIDICKRKFSFQVKSILFNHFLNLQCTALPIGMFTLPDGCTKVWPEPELGIAI